MSTSGRSYVNLKYLSEFNKYTTALGAAAFLYFDKFESGYPILRSVGGLFSATAVFIGIVIMSVLGRIQGEDIHYESERDKHKSFLFKVVSRSLFVQLLILVAVILAAGWLSGTKIWKSS